MGGGGLAAIMGGCAACIGVICVGCIGCGCSGFMNKAYAITSKQANKLDACHGPHGGLVAAEFVGGFAVKFDDHGGDITFVVQPIF